MNQELTWSAKLSAWEAEEKVTPEAAPPPKLRVTIFPLDWQV